MIRPRYLRPVAVTIVGLLVGTACTHPDNTVVIVRPSNDAPLNTIRSGSSGVGGVPTDQASGTADEPTTLTWEPLTEGVDVATLDVPVDYDDPTGPQFELFIARHPAADQANKIGTLLVNPGGPGFGGTSLVLRAEAIYGPELLARFDIVGWDPRGTGESTPKIDCIDDYDYYYAEIDSTPADDAGRQRLIDVAQDFADQCVAKNVAFIDYVGTNNSARDMNSIREALGEDKISYFGFSYGSELGATWATLFPETVRAAVLDGASDPTADLYTTSLQQMKGFEASLETFLNRCQDNPDCAFQTGGDARAAYEKLMADLDATPIQGDPGRPPVNRDIAINGVLNAMYDERFWPTLESALGDAQQGDGAGLLALHDDYFQRNPTNGTWDDSWEAFQVISCSDTPDRPDPEQVQRENQGLHEAAPLLVPDGSASGYFCTFFPPAVDPRVEITAAGAGPIVVIGTTGDPATPLNSSRRMARALEDGRLVIVEAEQHTGYGVNSCVNDIVRDYLINLIPPDDKVEC